MGNHIFISYSTRDAKMANQLVEYLEQNGIDCWIAPRNISSGRNYTDVIDTAIKNCAAIVLIFSEHSARSLWVKKELTLGVSNQKNIIPFKISNTETDGGLNFLLTDVQWVVATERPTEKFHLVIEGLNHVGSTAVTPPPPPPKPNRWPYAIGAAVLVALAVGLMSWHPWVQSEPTEELPVAVDSLDTMSTLVEEVAAPASATLATPQPRENEKAKQTKEENVKKAKEENVKQTKGKETKEEKAEQEEKEKVIPLYTPRTKKSSTTETPSTTEASSATAKTTSTTETPASKSSNTTNTLGANSSSSTTTSSGTPSTSATSTTPKPSSSSNSTSSVSSPTTTTSSSKPSSTSTSTAAKSMNSSRSTSSTISNSSTSPANTTAKTSTKKTTDPCKAKYNSARTAFDEGKYSMALKKFLELKADKCPQTDIDLYIQNCRKQLGEN